MQNLQKNRKKIVSRDEITEELKLIKGSLTDYITPSGEIYKIQPDGNFFHKAQWQTWGYWYCGITYKNILTMKINKKNKIRIIKMKENLEDYLMTTSY